MTVTFSVPSVVFYAIAYAMGIFGGAWFSAAMEHDDSISKVGSIALCIVGLIVMVITIRCAV